MLNSNILGIEYNSTPAQFLADRAMASAPAIASTIWTPWPGMKQLVSRIRTREVQNNY